MRNIVKKTRDGGVSGSSDNRPKRTDVLITYPGVERYLWDSAPPLPDAWVSSLCCCSFSLLRLHSGRDSVQRWPRDYCCPSYSQRIWNEGAIHTPNEQYTHTLYMCLNTKEPLNHFWKDPAIQSKTSINITRDLRQTETSYRWETVFRKLKK